MSVTFPSTFTFDATDMTISHTISDFANRLSFFANPHLVYFEGTLSDSAASKTSKYNFMIDVTDTCRTTALVSSPTRIISLPSVEY